MLVYRKHRRGGHTAAPRERDEAKNGQKGELW